MKSYGRRIANRAIFSRIDRKREISEGILWTVDEVSETCTVKIQGSDEQVRAHYPRNLTSLPSWLRVGNAVKVVHKQGKRDFVEVTGPGRAVPAPVSGDQFPGLSTLQDDVLDAVRVTPYVGYQVKINSGIRYRIDGVIYTLSGGETEAYIMGVDDIGAAGAYPIPLLGQIILDLGAPPSGNLFRYDIIVAGTDNLPNVVTGSAVASDPALPSVPSEHILLEKILRVGGETETAIYRIGQIWREPEATTVDVIAEEEMEWDGTNNYPEFELKVIVKDQYDRAFDGDGVGWVLSCELLWGSGQLYSEDSGYNETKVTQYTESSSYIFLYQRYQILDESSPFIQYALEGKPKIYSIKMHTLLNDVGDPIFGS